MAPKVTIGLPFHNPGRWFLAAISSIFAQDFDDWELLLVDDGSTDSSLRLARKITDERVTVLSDGCNRGLASRLNQIAQLAQGEYLARMDADDMTHSKRISKQVQYLDRHPEIDVLGTGAYVIDSANHITGIRYLHLCDPTPLSVLQRGFFVHPTVMARTDWFRHHPYDEGMLRAQDKELWSRTCRISTFEMIPEPLHFYRESDTFSLTKYSQSCRYDRAILSKYGPAEIGWLRTSTLILASHLKELTYHCLAMAGCEQMMVRRRNRQLSEQERVTAAKEIGSIVKTPVTGLAEL